MVEAVANAGIPIVLHGGGLWESAADLAPDKRAYIRRSDARIAELSSMTVSAAYLKGLLIDADTVFWSRPTIAAVLAAGAVERGAELRMMHAIQRAHYVEGSRVVEAHVLTDVARSVGLDADAFGRAIEIVSVDEHIAATRRLMRQDGIKGFPGFLMQRGGELVRVQHESFYGRPDAFLHAVEAAARTSPAA
ncbi:DsbA family protein [Novosphingopyxis sp.]|uniref:DsbA family protein n=1 Tax=Novosphingopyxis sp. TaxID=2709690 RepID=UPI003B5B476B